MNQDGLARDGDAAEPQWLCVAAITHRTSLLLARLIIVPAGCKLTREKAGQTSIPDGLGIVISQCDRALEGRDRIIQALELGQCDAEIVVSLGILWFQTDGTLMA